jgi:hypothetical protein
MVSTVTIPRKHNVHSNRGGVFLKPTWSQTSTSTTGTVLEIRVCLHSHKDTKRGIYKDALTEIPSGAAKFIEMDSGCDGRIL